MSNVTAELIHRSADLVVSSAADPILSSRSLIARRNIIVELMKAAMKEGVHFGTIPGTPKPTLYKPGAELLFSMFRISCEPVDTLDLSRRNGDGSLDEVRYQVKLAATSQVSGGMLGVAIGECSSSEEKYKWRKPVCPAEFDETSPELRREVWKKNSYKNTIEKVQQVRTNPTDVANTILQMASKRAYIALCRNVTACSDIFAAGLEDIPEEMRDAVVAEETPGEAKPHFTEPQRKSQTAPAATAPSHTPAKLYEIAETRLVKSGKTNGKDWTLYAIKTKDGLELTTFDDPIFIKAQEAKAGGVPVSIAFDVEEKDGKERRRITSLEVEG